MENNITKLKHITYILKEADDYQVSFQILEMDERFRADDFGFSKHRATNGMIIESIGIPELSFCSIYLRGTDKENDNLIRFYSTEEPKEHIFKVHEALHDWDENWEGFQKDADKDTEQEQDQPKKAQSDMLSQDEIEALLSGISSRDKEEDDVWESFGREEKKSDDVLNSKDTPLWAPIGQKIKRSEDSEDKPDKDYSRALDSSLKEHMHDVIDAWFADGKSSDRHLIAQINSILNIRKDFQDIVRRT